MAAKRVNRNFTQPGSVRHPIPESSSFERVVDNLGISPAEYESSIPLREWVRRNKDEKYVPTSLLRAFGFEVDG